MERTKIWFNKLEETLIASILGCMTVVTFANVIARYAFNSNILWALESIVFLFAWLVLLGASYAAKNSAHLGVDLIVNMLDPTPKKIMGLIATTICITFTILMLKGAWDYWANFANLPATTGRWFPTGFEETYREKGWYETNDIPMPTMFQWMANVFNEGEAYEKIPRLIPYFILPLSMALLLFRFIQSFVSIWKGTISSLIASHEVKDEIEAIKQTRKHHIHQREQK